MNRYHKKINDITALADKTLLLDENGIHQLKQLVDDYATAQKTRDIDVLLPFIVNVCSTQGYRKAIIDVLEILRQR